MKNVIVQTKTKKYSVQIAPGLLDGAGAAAAGVFTPGRAVVVTDSTVSGLYAKQLTSSLEKAGFSAVQFVFPAGEHSKSITVLTELLNFLADSTLTRSDAVFALGGGVSGDLSGLGSSLYLRGIHLVQLPTTLLAAVDSSVGGKTAVNLASGKNLVGTFYQPDLVLCDTDTMSTLPADEISNGCAEIIKYAMICDASLLDILTSPLGDKLPEVIARCVEIKRDIVSVDEHDNGERQLLNFGHTFGHAIEACSGYTVPHGHAVAAGMAVMTRACVKQGICGEECLSMLNEALVKHNLPTDTGYGEDALFSAVMSDKKRASGKITLVVPRTPGSCERLETSLDHARELLHLGLMKGGAE